jgi:hypothetical protein
MPDPLAFAEALAVAGYPKHIPVALVHVERFLWEAGYDAQRIRSAIDHIDAHGTARGCDDVNPEDIPAVDALIPEHLRVEIECVDGCKACEDAADFRRGLSRPADRTN